MFGCNYRTTTTTVAHSIDFVLVDSTGRGIGDCAVIVVLIWYRNYHWVALAGQLLATTMQMTTHPDNKQHYSEERREK